MSEKAQILNEYAEWAYKSLEETIRELYEEEAMWRPAEESNNIEWILNHIARISNIALPRIVKGDPNYKPANWPDDYKDHHYGIDRYMADIAAGKKVALDGIGKLTNAQLEEEISMWGGKKKRKEGLFAYIGEIIHHRGQIAFIRGTVKRRKEKDPDFLKC